MLLIPAIKTEMFVELKKLRVVERVARLREFWKNACVSLGDVSG